MTWIYYCLIALCIFILLCVCIAICCGIKYCKAREKRNIVTLTHEESDTDPNNICYATYATDNIDAQNQIPYVRTSPENADLQTALVATNV